MVKKCKIRQKWTSSSCDGCWLKKINIYNIHLHKLNKFTTIYQHETQKYSYIYLNNYSYANIHKIFERNCKHYTQRI